MMEKRFKWEQVSAVLTMAALAALAGCGESLTDEQIEARRKLDETVAHLKSQPSTSSQSDRFKEEIRGKYGRLIQTMTPVLIASGNGDLQCFADQNEAGERADKASFVKALNTCHYKAISVCMSNGPALCDDFLMVSSNYPELRR